MRASIVLLILLTACSDEMPPATESVPTTAAIPRSESLAKQYLIVDTHIDVPYRIKRSQEDISEATDEGQFDYPRALRGGLNAPFMSIYIPASVDEEGGAKMLADELIDLMEAVARGSPQKFALAYSTEQVRQNFADGQISLPLGMENGAPIEGKLENVQYFYDRGIRYITLTHSKSNHISDSSYDDNRQWNGLSKFGKQLIGEMNRLGIMVDVSHISDEAFYQVMELSKVPVIASHSSARHFTPGFERNMDDEMIKRLASRGGVIQILFGSGYISATTRTMSAESREAITRHFEEQGLSADSEEGRAFLEKYREENPYPYAALADLLDHFDHVRDLVGVEYVGIGSDFEGVGNTMPTDIKDVSQYPNLIEGLLTRGYSEADIEKILAGNLMRVWRQVEDFARQQKDVPPH
ncbi:MAG: dipeptidase [Pseudomonadales bacterium]|jgi:membrane dipeptidase|nr:dipeptidase [Pseudomonadales bacterium]MDP7594098.1 dipeptidase [Pseudomonadales bacterium]HJN50511.1 dipeptidase [Pseudomonadales bacterium]|tara:strand:- start:6214 stop:7446 length:1233 start_codon:yes stop_codon:yes gene_type:complete